MSSKYFHGAATGHVEVSIAPTVIMQFSQKGSVFDALISSFAVEGVRVRSESVRDCVSGFTTQWNLSNQDTLGHEKCPD